MKIKKSIYYLLFIMISNSCNNFNYSHWNVSDFNLNSNEERNGKEVQLIYTSSYPSNFDELDVYIHYVAFISETNDTFNILSPMAYSIEKNELDTKFIMYNERDVVYKAMVDVKQMQNNKNYNFNVKRLKYERVLRDPNFDEIAKNDYETEFAIVFRPDDITNTTN